MFKRIAALFVALTTLAAAPSVVWAQGASQPKKILIVVSSLDKKAPNLVGGYWFPELTHPVEVYDKAGIEFDIASPKGGLSPFDGFDLKDQATLDFWTNAGHRTKIANSIKLSDVDPTKYAAVQLVGGHGPMWDFVDNPELDAIIRSIHDRGGIVSAVCHGPAGLLGVRLANGERLIKGKKLTGFTAEEEASRGYDRIVPFELEGALKTAGAAFEEAPIFQSRVVVDGRLITGQNPASAREFGEAVAKALGSKS
ncbi:type 1 glutamine amidotransferase domain-containing protein [Enterovirga rhinocerotis]|uniref:Putative intracellular protease/amidase n=1 Tax=Enterovirga rhinocerotis TaxID=1339210 RepID=A0A4R7C8Z0_9HYPH|nr:type 1 glutamine amidotransferase domain-containing protein [Enterovirga rhinocerotis]TDR94743.1 putative intracellular protease/amidase [Enterovirga rhinocerotis]